MKKYIKVARTLMVSMILCFTALTVMAQVPARPDPPRLVNDFAGILGDCEWLEDSLQKIAMETSNQICIVTMNDLGGFAPVQMAYTIGDKWGVGKADKDNGVVILIKPKTPESKGEAFIAPGSGLEGAITDVTSTHIVNQEMIPYFKENDYLGGVWAGAQVVRDLAVGEYNQEDYVNQYDEGDAWLGFIVFVLIMALIIYGATRKGGGNSGNRNTGTWGGPVIISHGSGWGGHSGGSWSGGGGGHSWGGFGGGSFGGGGGGGSW